MPAPTPLTLQAGATQPNVVVVVTRDPLAQAGRGQAIPGGLTVPGSLKTNKIVSPLQQKNNVQYKIRKPDLILPFQ